MVRITNVLRTMAECSPMSSLGDGNLTKLYVGYAQISYKLKMDFQCCPVGKGLISCNIFCVVVIDGHLRVATTLLVADVTHW